MPAQNSITNDPILSKPYSSAYASGWEACFLKKPQEWLDIIYGGTVQMLDPDGFREKDGATWETPMKREEFERRFQHCTILNKKYDSPFVH